MGFNSKYTGAEVERLLDSIKNSALVESISWENIKNRPSSIEGYGITNVYNKTEIDKFLLKYVTLSTDQNITGIKSFINGFKLGDALVTYNKDKKTFVLQGNLLVEGGLAWNSSIEGFNPQTITDAVVVDGVTIGKDETTGALKVIGYIGGGLDEEALQEYLDLNKYATIPLIEDELQGYATTSAVDKLSDSVDDLSNDFKDFLESSDTDSIINKWKELEAFLLGLSESDNLAEILQGKADKANTLEGYGITDAYTKSESELKFIDFTSRQEVTGIKNFTNGLEINGFKIFYDSEKNTLVVKGNLLVEKGIAWNSSIDGFDPNTIMESLDLDPLTLKINEFGQLTVIGGGSGGSGGGSIAYPLTWSGYSSGSYDGSSPKNIAIPELLSQLANDEGYIKGVSSDMIVDALGYTPYSSTNPNGYITSSALASYATTASVNAMLLDYATKDFVTSKGYITSSALTPYITTESVNSLLTSYVQKSAIKSELGISDWALAATKPSYSWSEIGSHPTSLSQFTNDVGYITNSVSGDFTADGMVRGTAYLSTGYKQISANIDASIRSSIYGDAGSHWGQIKTFRTGSAASYGSLSGSYAAGLLFAMADTHAFIQLPSNASRTDDAIIGGGGSDKISWSAKLLHSLNYSNYALPITGGTVSGDVTINYNGNTPLVINQNYGTTSNPRGVVVMNSTLSNGNLYISHLFGKEGSTRNSAWVGFYLDSAGSNNNRLSMGLYGVDNVLNVLGSGNVAIGGTTASAKLHVHGDFLATGEVTQHSSLVLKDVVDTRFLSLKELVALKPYSFRWRDGRDDKLHAGAVADYVKPILPEVISTDKDDIHSMNYANAAWVVSTSLTPYVSKLVEEMKMLKARVKYLEDKLKES